jgi:hypothetical protein
MLKMFNLHLLVEEAQEAQEERVCSLPEEEEERVEHMHFQT